MNIYNFLKKQIRIKSVKDIFLLLLKLVVAIIIADEIYTAIYRISCLLTSKHYIGELFVFCIKYIILIVLIYLVYRLMKMFKRKGVLGKVAIILVIIIALIYWANGSILGIYHFDGPYWGRVIDADTGEPIQGANVMGKWEIESHFLIVASNDYADARETITDSEGKFILPLARKTWLWPFSWLYLEDLYVYKSGYDSHPPRIQQVWSKVEKEKWKEKLVKLNPNYNHESDPSVNYYMTFYKFTKDTKPYKPTIIKLNRALSKKEQTNAISGFPYGGFDCEYFKIKKFEKALGRRRG